MIKFYFDMDGCLAEYRYGAPFEALYLPDYFRSLNPNWSILGAAKNLVNLKDRYPIDVYSLSAILDDHKTAKREKIEWLDEFFPELDEDHRIFTVCGENKSDYIEIDENCILIDDFGTNINDFLENNGQAVKVSKNFRDMLYEEEEHAYSHFINPYMTKTDITNYLLGFVDR